MSTKGSIAYSQNRFHFYHECFDGNHVYLELERVGFVARPGRVRVRIPMAIWECIRQYPGADFTWADKSDDDIQTYVTAQVIERWQWWESGNKLAAAFGSLVYGAVEDPREQQIERGVTWYKDLRQRQLELRQQVADLLAAQHRPPP